MNNKLVSIIIPCYNQARYLPEALQSVLTQTYSDWECIIVNDGSTDNTEDVAKEWTLKDKRFKYINKKNGGLSSARNAGLLMADGEYIQLLDSDDLLESDKIKHQVEFLYVNDKKIEVVISGYRYFQDQDPARELLIFGPLDLLPEVALNSEDKKDIIKLFSRTNPMVVSAPLYHKSTFDKVGTFDENLTALEDWDFHFRCIINGISFQHSGYMPKSKTLIRIHNHSMSHNRRNMIKSLRRLQQKHKNNYIFAVENNLVFSDFKKSLIRSLKFVTPPAFIWLIKKILRLA